MSSCVRQDQTARAEQKTVVLKEQCGTPVDVNRVLKPSQIFTMSLIMTDRDNVL